MVTTYRAMHEYIEDKHCNWEKVSSSETLISV